MTSKSGSERSNELNFLRDWCTIIIRFIGSLAPQPNPSTQFEQAIDQAFQRGDLQGLRTISRDLLEWATGLAPQEQERLDEILHSKFGRGLRDESQERLKEIDSILKRGQIKDEDEYRLLLSRVDETYGDDSKAEEMEKINELLQSFEQSIGTE